MPIQPAAQSDTSTADLGSRPATDHSRGLVPVSERMVMLLDIDQLIGTEITSLGQLEDLVA